MKYIKLSHGVYCLQYHVVWVCKYRRRILNPGVCEYLRKLLPALAHKIPGVQIETIGFDKDHLHMVMVSYQYMTELYRFTFVAACSLSVYASLWSLPSSLQDSIRRLF